MQQNSSFSLTAWWQLSSGLERVWNGIEIFPLNNPDFHLRAPKKFLMHRWGSWQKLGFFRNRTIPMHPKLCLAEGMWAWMVCLCIGNKTVFTQNMAKMRGTVYLSLLWCGNISLHVLFELVAPRRHFLVHGSLLFLKRRNLAVFTSNYDWQNQKSKVIKWKYNLSFNFYFIATTVVLDFKIKGHQRRSYIFWNNISYIVRMFREEIKEGIVWKVHKNLSTDNSKRSTHDSMAHRP